MSSKKPKSSICKFEESTTAREKSRGGGGRWELGLCASLPATCPLVPRWRIGLLWRHVHLAFSKVSITSLALSPFEAANRNISTQSLPRGFPSRCLRLHSFVVYGVSKLWRFQNRKKETEKKIIFFTCLGAQAGGIQIVKRIFSNYWPDKAE